MIEGQRLVDLAAERSLQKLVLAAHAEGLLASAHDCSDGGLSGYRWGVHRKQILLQREAQQ